jgi:hypothetical protein
MNTSNPNAPGTTQAWTDPLGDTFGFSPIRPDLTGMKAAVGDEVVCLTIEIDDLVLGYGDGTQYVFGYVDLDLDQNANTGSGFEEGPCLTQGRIGYEAYVPFENSGLTTVVPIYIMGVVPQGGSIFPLAGLSYSENSITIAMPKKTLGDGYFDVVVEIGNADEFTDCLPSEGVVSVGEPKPANFGDVNCSGGIDVADIGDLLAFAGGVYDGPAYPCSLVGELLPAAYPASGTLLSGDMDCDNEVTTFDALLLLRFVADASTGVSVCPEPGTPPIQ